MIKRTRYFVSVKFQLKYILYILLFIYMGAAIAGYTVYYTTWETLGEKLANVYPRGRLIHIFNTTNMELVLRLLLITPLFILIGTILSHRIAGPIYRIGKYVDSLMSGDLTRNLSLRKKDELKPIAAKLSELCRQMKDDRAKRQRIAAAVVDKLSGRQIDASVIDDIKKDLMDFSS
jgi:methyl-accepting chemotaxis protein